MTNVIDIARGRDGWLNHPGIRNLLNVGSWFAEPTILADDPVIVAIRDRMHAHISRLNHYPERCLFNLEVEPVGNEGLVKMLRRLHDERDDPAWPTAVALSLMHLTHPDGFLLGFQKELEELGDRPIRTRDEFVRVLARLDEAEIEAVAGTLVGTVHYALRDAWETREYIRQPELQIGGAQPLPEPFALPKPGDWSIDASYAPALVDFSDPEDFPATMVITDMSEQVQDFHDSFGITRWSILAGDHRVAARPLSAVAEPQHRRICLVVRHDAHHFDPGADLDGRHDARTETTLLQVLLQARQRQRALELNVELVATTADALLGENVALAAILDYWRRVVDEMDQEAAPGEIVTVHLLPERSGFDGFMMRLESHLASSLDDEIGAESPTHGFVIDVRRSRLGRIHDRLPLLGQHVAPPARAHAWIQLEDDMSRLGLEQQNTTGATSIIYDDEFTCASHGYDGTAFDEAIISDDGKAALDRLESHETSALIADYKRRYGWTGDVAIIHLAAIGTFIMPGASWTDDGWGSDHQVVAHYRKHPHDVAERRRALEFWRVFDRRFDDIIG